MKRKVFIMLVMCLLLTGCSEDMFDNGVTDTNYVSPYANRQGYILVNYDLKEVEPREDNLLNEFDFSGPMNSYFETNNSNSSSVIAIPDQTTESTDLGINDELDYCATSGYVAPMVPNDSGSITITSSFGPRWGRTHGGLDIGCPEGTKLYAINSGTVASVGNNPDAKAGIHVIIEHENDILGNTSSIYMHCTEILVEPGDKIEKGQLIALSGNTGNSTGPHLHIGIKDSSGTYIDPEPLLNLENFLDNRKG